MSQAPHRNPEKSNIESNLNAAFRIWTCFSYQIHGARCLFVCFICLFLFWIRPHGFGYFWITSPLKFPHPKKKPSKRRTFGGLLLPICPKIWRECRPWQSRDNPRSCCVHTSCPGTQSIIFLGGDMWKLMRLFWRCHTIFRGASLCTITLKEHSKHAGACLFALPSSGPPPFVWGRQCQPVIEHELFFGGDFK